MVALPLETPRPNQVPVQDRSMSVRDWPLASAIAVLILCGPILAILLVVAAEMLTDMLTGGDHRSFPGRCRRNRLGSVSQVRATAC
jgi:hypothetical protein